MKFDLLCKFADARNALTFALPGDEGSYAVEAFTQDPFIHQEMIEILYHTLWESVHVFLGTSRTRA